MIPKTIHYCWFGRNPLPKSAIKCIESWKKFFPDYKIIQWNEDNFDVNSVPYTAQAYACKKYAFVSDFARFKILYERGGVYFDTDVEVVKDFDHIVAEGAFMGIEKSEGTSKVNPQGNVGINPGLGIAVEPGDMIYREILNMYSRLDFDIDAGTIVEYTTFIMKKYGFDGKNRLQKIGNINIFPDDYFCPMHPYTRSLEITENTVSIHHYDATWVDGGEKMRKMIKRMLGPKITRFGILVKRLLFGKRKGRKLNIDKN